LPENEDKFKVLLCGEAAVGKTSLVKAFVKTAFDDKYKITIGVDLFNKIIKRSPTEKAILGIWDIGGDEKFDFIRSTFYKGAAGVLLVFDLTNKVSFDKLPHWMDDIKKSAPDAQMVLLGNKSDLISPSKKIIEDRAIEAFCKENKCAYFETSAKTGKNVDEAFEKLTKMVFAKCK
jgi:small GTP-binding protein